MVDYFVDSNILKPWVYDLVDDFVDGFIIDDVVVCKILKKMKKYGKRDFVDGKIMENVLTLYVSRYVL